MTDHVIALNPGDNVTFQVNDQEVTFSYADLAGFPGFPAVPAAEPPTPNQPEVSAEPLADAPGAPVADTTSSAVSGDNAVMTAVAAKNDDGDQGNEPKGEAVAAAPEADAPKNPDLAVGDDTEPSASKEEIVVEVASADSTEETAVTAEETSPNPPETAGVPEDSGSTQGTSSPTEVAPEPVVEEAVVEETVVEELPPSSEAPPLSEKPDTSAGSEEDADIPEGKKRCPDCDNLASNEDAACSACNHVFAVSD